MTYYSNRYCKIFISLLIGLFVSSCAKKAVEDPDEVMLVRINDSITISKNEFIRRAEFILRPPYCNKSGYIDKKIVLNSLIAEKMLALEAGMTNELIESDGFKRFVKGRKEQAMRRWMLFKEADEKVKLDSAEIARYYKFVGHEYDVAYYPVKDITHFNRAMNSPEENDQYFESFFRVTYGDTTIPMKTIAWSEYEKFDILKSFFTGGLNKGDILQPIKINKDYHLIFKVLGWRDTKVYSESQTKARWTFVTERLKREKAAKIWDNLVAKIMQEKTLEFDKSVFWIVSNIFSKYYVKSDEQLNKELKSSIWNALNIESKKISLELKDILNEPFFQIDGKTWTVKDFQNELISHPLVFRKKKISNKEFSQQFRLVIADLIRDVYITREAYKKGYDKVNSVRREERTWRDAYLAVYQRDRYLESVAELENFSKNYLRVINSHLNMYVENLQLKYDKKIELNVIEFEKIKLTNIDLYVQQVGMPFKQAVPGFPILTTNHNLGYITRLDE
jgi:hypothetical protein